MPENLNFENLICQKHGPAPYMIVNVPGGPLKFWCLTCLEDTFTRLGVHEMFPAPGKPDSAPVDEWPEELLEVK